MRWRDLTRCASKFAREKIASGFLRESVAAEAAVVGGPWCLYDLSEGVYQITGTSSDIYQCVPRGGRSRSRRVQIYCSHERAARVPRITGAYKKVGREVCARCYWSAE